MPKTINKKNTLLLIVFFFLILFTLFNSGKIRVYAKDECKDIDDKDDQFECYASMRYRRQKKRNISLFSIKTKYQLSLSL